MELEFVDIKNFRSIADARIEFRPSCRILVGINEAGKSNILRALSALGDFMPSKTEDLREPLATEEPITESSIHFAFRLAKDDIDAVLGVVRTQLPATASLNRPIAADAQRTYTLASFVGIRNTGLYHVDVLAQKKNGRYWTIGKQFSLDPNWAKPSPQCPAEFSVVVDSNPPVPLKSFTLFSKLDFPDIPAQYITDASITDLVTIVGQAVASHIVAHLPRTISWQYSDQNLLPGSLSLSTFAADPTTCRPLQQMFRLAGITDIATSIADLAALNHNQRRNFFNGIAKKTTLYIRRVWKECKNIDVELVPQADSLTIGIREENTYDMVRRSDGFKRFVSFLIMISTQATKGDIAGALLLIDEPDASLHPSGARYLLNELLRIARTNYVVYSTHSIFMVDRDRIGRHMIVTKKRERTTVAIAQGQDFVDEEVLFNALGFSLFDVLKRHNIVFEGWRDKRLYQVAMRGLPTRLKAHKALLSETGICHVQGVRAIKGLTPRMELLNRTCLIISDSDQAARAEQKEYLKAKGYGIWLRYDEILGSGYDVVTGEDFLTGAAFRPSIEELRRLYPSLPILDVQSLTGSHGRLAVLRKWLTDGGLEPSAVHAEIAKIKEHLFGDLTPAALEPTYFDFLEKLAVRLQELTAPTGT